MSVFDFDNGNENSGGRKWWNFSKKDKEGFSNELVGWLVELSDPCATVFGKDEIKRFKDGNPMRNIRMTILNAADGQEYSWDFAPGGRDNRERGGEDKRSGARRAVEDGIKAVLPGSTSIEAVLGMKVRISTEEAPGNFTYSKANPRPWKFEVNPKDSMDHRGVVHLKDWEKEGGDEVKDESELVSDDPKLAAAQRKALQAVRNQQFQTAPANDVVPVELYDEDIPF